MKKGKRGAKTTAKFLKMPIKIMKLPLRERIQQIEPTEANHLEDQEAIEAFPQEVKSGVVESGVVVAEAVDEVTESSANMIGMKITKMAMAQAFK